MISKEKRWVRQVEVCWVIRDGLSRGVTKSDLRVSEKQELATVVSLLHWFPQGAFSPVEETHTEIKNNNKHILIWYL